MHFLEVGNESGDSWRALLGHILASLTATTASVAYLLERPAAWLAEARGIPLAGANRGEGANSSAEASRSAEAKNSAEAKSSTEANSDARSLSESRGPCATPHKLSIAAVMVPDTARQ
jgi:hypothetical protein